MSEIKVLVGWREVREDELVSDGCEMLVNSEEEIAEASGLVVLTK